MATTYSPYKIRRANVRDIINIIDYIEEVHGDGGRLYPPIEDHICVYNLQRIIAEHTILIAEDDAMQMVGVMILQVYTMFWNNSQKFMTNPWWSVHPAMRTGTGLAKKFISVAKRIARENELRLVIEIKTDEAPEVKDRFIKQNGLEYIGGKLFYDGRKDGQR